MATTTHITVVCPNCAKECGMSFRQVAVSVDETINDAWGPKMITRLRAEITALGPHQCNIEDDKPVTLN